MREKGIAIIDFGSQYTQTIARRIRYLNVFSEIFDSNIRPSELENAVGVIGSGGPASVYEAESPRCNPKIWTMNMPKLLICYAFQLFAHEEGGRTVKGNKSGEYGKAKLIIENDASIFKDLPETQTVWMSHGDRVESLPPGMLKLAYTKDCEFAAAYDPDSKTIGFQFHPEVDDTEFGMQMLNNFLNLCKRPEKEWTYQRFIEEVPERIREFVGGRNVVHLTSGGKDSSIAAVFIDRTIKEASKKRFLYINCGVGRKDEVKKVVKNLKDIGIELIVLDTSEELEKELFGITDAEEKREIIGRHYIRHAQLFAGQEYGNNWVIGQGTIYPDHIESKGTKNSAKIKTHHNRVKEVLELMKQGKILEPNLYLFKDDIETIAKIFAETNGLEGLAEIFAPQHPFPGPGLAIRSLCSKGETRNDFKELTSEVKGISRKYNLDALVLPILSVGVQGDGRTYAPPVAIWGKTRSWDELAEISTMITNTMKGRVNRVIIPLQPSEIKNVDLRESYITRERLKKLQEADHITMKHLEESKEMKNIQQCPTIAIPLEINSSSGESIVLRPFKTRDFMTGTFGRLSNQVIDDVVKEILGLGYGAVFYDITNKPPGTTEWE
ncbi:glutamine-hydrolyzing GMP synthase [Candidatus Woesearchaeota archaeon]|nr:glutamine-hydrolyzing GMP synthase [Candidatus Woesearchaeota archaeon]